MQPQKLHRAPRARRFAQLFSLLFGLAVLSPSRGHAQFSGDTFSAGVSGRGDSITGSQIDTVYSYPLLQGATNGTIGTGLPGDAFDPYADGDADFQDDAGDFQFGEYVVPEFESAGPDFPAEVIREDPRGIDLPDPLSDAARDTYCRKVVEFQGQEKARSLTASQCIDVGIAYANLGQNRPALDLLKRAAKLDAQCDAAFYNQGTIYSNEGRYVEALKSYNRALSVRASARAYYHLGFTYAVIGMPEMAVRTFDRAISLCPTDRKALFERGLAKAKLGLAEDALTDFDRALTKGRVRASWLLNRALAKARLERNEAALVDFDAAIRLDDAPSYYNERGKVFLKIEEYNAALYDFNEALHRDSGFKNAYENRADVYGKLGRSGPAVDDLIMARRLASGT